MKNSFLFLVFLLNFFLTPPSRATKIEDYVISLMNTQKIPGLSFVILKEGKVVKNKSYGYANLEHKVVTTPETVYQIASIGKQFLATLVMMLVQNGTLCLQDSINKYIKNTPLSWEKITIQHLLNHTSGLGDYTKSVNPKLEYTDDQFIKVAASLPLKFQPGEQWGYSNTGYMLLGLIVQCATGKFYGDLFQDHIFKPLKMDTSRLISEEEIVPHRAAGYHLIKGILKNQAYVSPSLNRMGDGSLYMTVLDLIKWDKALYSERLLKQSNLKKNVEASHIKQ